MVTNRCERALEPDYTCHISANNYLREPQRFGRGSLGRGQDGSEAGSASSHVSVYPSQPHKEQPSRSIDYDPDAVRILVDFEVRLLRESLESLLRHCPGLTVVSQSEDYAERGSGSSPVDVILIEADAMPPSESFRRHPKARQAGPHFPGSLAQERLLLAPEDVRQVAMHIRKRRREADEAKKRAYIEKYIPQVAIGLQQILGFNDVQRDKVIVNLTDVLERSRKM